MPSRRSVDSQRGGRSIVLEGHVRFGRCNGVNFRYFFHGSFSMGMVASGAEKQRMGMDDVRARHWREVEKWHARMIHSKKFWLLAQSAA